MNKKITLVLVTAIVIVLKGSAAFYWPCDSTDDCLAEGSECYYDTGECKCKEFDAVFSQSYTKCLKTSQFGDTCDESVQCNLMPSGASCKSGVCDCADGHTYVRGRCRPLNGLGEPCDSDTDCYFAYDRQSVTCRNQVCECANGYYHRYGNICRRKSMEIDDACVVNADCKELGDNVKCINLSCQSGNEETTESSSTTTVTTTTTATKTAKNKTKNSSTLFNKSKSYITESSTTIALLNGRNDLTETDLETDPLQKLREIAVQTSIDSLELKPIAPKLKNAATSTGSADVHNWRSYRRRQSTFRSDDDNKTLSTLSNTDDEGEDKKYGSFCTENGKSCAGLPHSICTSNICLCKQGYYHKNSKCFAELGEIAESADECEYTFDDLSKQCICQKNFFFERNLRSCRKPIQYHLSCTSNSQCSPFGAVYCHPEIPRRCTCEEYAEYDELQQMCVYKQGLGAECDTNDGCPVTNSICSNRICVCKENYMEKEGACVPGIGAECENDNECTQENSVCEPTMSTSGGDKERSCQCRKGFVHFKDECLKEADDINEACVETEQCKPLLATCIDKKCSCTSEQHFMYKRCEDKKGLNEACSRAGECFIEKEQDKVECRNSVCQCKFGYQSDVEQKACIRVIPNKKNSSGRPSVLKIITFILIGSAFLITSAAIKQAYY